MRYGVCSLLKTVWWPIVVYFCVIWSIVKSCLIGNITTSSFLYNYWYSMTGISNSRFPAQLEAFIPPKKLTTDITGISTPRFPALLEALIPPKKLTTAITGISTPRFPALLEAFITPDTFSLVLLASNPICTKSSNSLTSSSNWSFSPWILEAMLAKALITCGDTCLKGRNILHLFCILAISVIVIILIAMLYYSII